VSQFVCPRKRFDQVRTSRTTCSLSLFYLLLFDELHSVFPPFCNCVACFPTSLFCIFPALLSSKNILYRCAPYRRKMLFSRIVHLRRSQNPFFDFPFDRLRGFSSYNIPYCPSSIVSSSQDVLHAFSPTARVAVVASPLLLVSFGSAAQSHGFGSWHPVLTLDPGCVGPRLTGWTDPHLSGFVFVVIYFAPESPTQSVTASFTFPFS